MFEFKKKISFYDCDPAGIVFFGRVYELCHSAYESMIEGFELKEDYWTNEKYLVPIIKSEASYRNAIKYGETVTINVKVAQLKSSSFELNYEILNDEKQLCTEVKTVHVFVDKATWKKTAMPDYLKSNFEEYKKD